jgi:capsular exopolysaccharide synthesis family protein
MEQYRRLAAALLEAQSDSGLKVVMVTSAVPQEGKTLTVVNLALTLTESYGRSVLLIDTDLRRPSIHEVLGLPNEKGVSDVLRSDSLDSSMVHVSSRLSVLTSGRVEHNPLAELSSDRMRRVIEDASARFDWVLLDTPPVGVLSDAQLVGRLAQAAVFVIRAGSTGFPVISKAIDQLGRDRIIGTVLNGVDEQQIGGAGYYNDYHR